MAFNSTFSVIDPRVDFLSYGPTLKLIDEKNKKETLLIPDDLVYGAAGVTFKGINFINDVIKLKSEGVDFTKKRDNSIIKSAGAGHASMTTSIGFWTILQGDCSKMVDSIFTGATYISALMPSSRRIPITEESIIVPKGIVNKGGRALNLYLETSKKNINFYEQITNKENHLLSEQDASKIVQYGHSGGGFLFMPLETLVYFSKLAEAHPEDMPLEGREIITQLEKLVHEKGMGVAYESRKNAPRASNPNPNIFHHRKNLAQEVFEDNFDSYSFNPILLSASDNFSEERDKRIVAYLEHRKKAFTNPADNWKKSLEELEEIVSDFNLSIKAETFVNSPWRIWGEVKRHRTLDQNVESIYNALQRTFLSYNEILSSSKNKEEYIKNLRRFISVPEAVAKSASLLDAWQKRFFDSINAYDNLLNWGIKESDAITIIPRGAKLGIIKHFDLSNLTTLYMSLRTCKGTVEPEMEATTEKERALILRSSKISEKVKKLISPKCHYGGFCPESDYKKCCGAVRQVTPNYNEEMHKAIWNKREEEIRSKI